MHVFLFTLAALAEELFLLIGYYAHNSFPQPLATDDERKYLLKMAEGDMEARNVLIEHNLRLVAHIIKKFETTIDKEDLISIGTIGLIKGINTFDINCGTRLATYAARCIENEILMYFRSLSRKRAEVSLQEPLGFDNDGNEIKFEDILSYEDSVLKEVEANILSERIIAAIDKKLHGKEKQVLAMRFGLSGRKRRTQKEIARMLGISRSYVSRIEKKAIQKIARDFR
ncbi:MAG: RNA polymerase sporulation sigma factor SigK [Firmicutes bacterium]|nr:RNA polymerase sporulation sigma factor SigK [Bacillota bacterium]